MALNERSPLAAFNQGSGFAVGAPGVQYDDQGRLQVPTDTGGAARPGFFWRSATTAAPTTNVRTRWSFLPWNHGAKQDVYASGAATAPMVTTRYDDYSVMPGLGYRDFAMAEAPQQTVVTQRRVALPPAVSDQLVVEEMKVYNEHPPWWWLFIIDGIILIILGILNILWCIDFMYYSRFWTGVMLIIFGIVGSIHRGDYYKQKWKSILYIILGILTAGCVYACLCFTMNNFCHQLIEIAQFDDKDAYISEMEFRYSYLGLKPMYLINNNLATNIWVCFAIDGITLVVLAVDFLVLSSVVYVLDLYYNSNWQITRKVEPFCAPNVFNPWGQVSLGQAMIFIGMVLDASIHGNNVITWQTILAPVWSGVVPILAGAFAAISLKSCGLQHRCWNFLAIILEIISAIISIVAIVIVIIGMIENIQTLEQSTVMNYTSFAQRMMLASSLIFCVSAIVCLVNVFYSVALLIRLIICACCTPDETNNIPVEYYYDDQTVLSPLNAQTTTVVGGPVKVKRSYGGLWNHRGRVPVAGRATTFVDQFESPYQAGQDTRAVYSVQ